MAQRTCSVDGCEKSARSRGWCGLHYMRWRRNGDPEKLIGSGRRPQPPRIIRCPVCHRTIRYFAKGMCKRCYENARQRSRPMSVKTRAYRERWAAANPQKIAALKAAYRRANPDKEAAARARRRARRLGNGVFSRTTRDRRRQIARQRGCCFYCGASLQPGRLTHEEHVIPLNRGGRDSVGNVVYACRGCNLSKRDKTITEWRQYLRRQAAKSA